jgi:1,2-phenylacetyl-CoA epoxidase catalytic subunit
MIIKGRQIYEQIKNLNELKDELNRALNELEDADLRSSRAYDVVRQERDKVAQEYVDKMNKEYTVPELAVPEPDGDFF